MIDEVGRHCQARGGVVSVQAQASGVQGYDEESNGSVGQFGL